MGAIHHKLRHNRNRLALPSPSKFRLSASQPVPVHLHEAGSARSGSVIPGHLLDLFRQQRCGELFDLVADAMAIDGFPNPVPGGLEVDVEW